MSLVVEDGHISTRIMTWNFSVCRITYHYDHISNILPKNQSYVKLGKDSTDFGKVVWYNWKCPKGLRIIYTVIIGLPMADCGQVFGRIVTSQNHCGTWFRFDIICHSMKNIAILASKWGNRSVDSSYYKKWCIIIKNISHAPCGHRIKVPTS